MKECDKEERPQHGKEVKEGRESHAAQPEC